MWIDRPSRWSIIFVFCISIIVCIPPLTLQKKSILQPSWTSGHALNARVGLPERSSCTATNAQRTIWLSVIYPSLWIDWDAWILACIGVWGVGQEALWPYFLGQPKKFKWNSSKLQSCYRSILYEFRTVQCGFCIDIWKILAEKIKYEMENYFMWMYRRSAIFLFITLGRNSDIRARNPIPRELHSTPCAYVGMRHHTLHAFSKNRWLWKYSGPDGVIIHELPVVTTLRCRTDERRPINLFVRHRTLPRIDCATWRWSLSLVCTSTTLCAAAGEMPCMHACILLLVKCHKCS